MEQHSINIELKIIAFSDWVENNSISYSYFYQNPLLTPVPLSSFSLPWPHSHPDLKLPFLVAIASPSPSQHEGGENRVCSSPVRDHRVYFSSVPDRRRLQSIADLNVILEPDRSSGESQLLSLTHSSSSGIWPAIPAAAFSDSLATLPCCGSRLHLRRLSSPSLRETIMISARNSNSSPDFDDLSTSCSPVASLLSPMTAASPVAQWMLWGQFQFLLNLRAIFAI